jgi:hypothetical protein
MAKGTDVAETVEAPLAWGYSDEEFAQFGEAETVHVEAGDQLIFDTVGDLYIGLYAGHEVIYPNANDPDPIKARKWFIQLKWTDPEGSKFTNAGYELRTAYVNVTLTEDGRPVVTDKVAIGSMTRNELMKLVDVDQQSEMKSFRVAVAKPRNADSNGS